MLLEILFIILVLFIVVTFWFCYYLSSYEKNFSKKISQHDFVISLTTTPVRISKIKDTLESLLHQSVTNCRVILNLPKLFRQKESYVIQPWLVAMQKEYPNLILNRMEKDYGPASKLVGAVQYLSKESDTYIFFCDDDIIYPPRMIEYFDAIVSYQSERPKDESLGVFARPKAVFAADVHTPNNDILRKYLHVSVKVDFSYIGGFAGVCVHREMFEDDFWSYMDNVIKNIDCRLSDDIVFGYYFHQKGIPVYEVGSSKYGYDVVNIMLSLKAYGYLSDALHAGAGGLTEKHDDHYKKYCRCLEYLKQ